MSTPAPGQGTRVALWPDAAAVERFATGLAAALGRPVTDSDKVALAVSGGADSMAMLVLAAAALPGQVAAATVDHQLRRASADEAAMVARHCAQIGVPHAIFAPEKPIDRTNVQANARAARYWLLQRWAVASDATMLATAHHADDQAETFLMRATRGSGVAGLAGIRAHQRVEVAFQRPVPANATGVTYDGDSCTLDIVRPLLGWRTAELRALTLAAGAPFVDDPSNTDDHYDRTRFRALLRDQPLLDVAQIARAAAHAAEADETLRAIEHWAWKHRRRWPMSRNQPAGKAPLDDGVWFDLTDLPREIKRRLARAAIAAVRDLADITRPEFSAATNIESLLDALEAGKSATQAGVMASVESGGLWQFREEPQRRSR